MKTSIVTRGSLVEVLAPVDSLSNKAGRRAMAMALNHTLGKAETQVNRALVRQTGLKYREVKQEVKRYSAYHGNLEGEIKVKGDYHKLAEFAARNTKRGMSAAPWGVRRIFKGTFFVGGSVFKRLGEDRFPVKALYGPALPKEVLKGEARAAFERTIHDNLPRRIEHELGRLFAK